jgi:YesN/AraC family two-component response regulator
MSIDGETSRVMKGVQHGACDYLLKPVRMKELRNIWQHVYRKKMHEVKEIEGNDSCDDLQILRNSFEGLDEKSLFMRSDSDTMRKRKDVDKDHADQESSDGNTVKKARVVWSVDLHQKFVNAVNQIGFDSECSPKTDSFPFSFLQISMSYNLIPKEQLMLSCRSWTKENTGLDECSWLNKRKRC